MERTKPSGQPHKLINRFFFFFFSNVVYPSIVGYLSIIDLLYLYLSQFYLKYMLNFKYNLLVLHVTDTWQIGVSLHEKNDKL